MPRIRPLTPPEMTPEQRAVHDRVVAGRRGHAPAPLLAWLLSPEFAQRAQHLGEFLRYETSLPPRLVELAILVTARFWSAPYVFHAHRAEALRAGLEPAVIDAIARRCVPEFRRDDERVAYDFGCSLHETHAVPDALYRAAVAAVGERGVAELVGVLAYYTLTSMTVNVFELNPPGVTDLEP